MREYDKYIYELIKYLKDNNLYEEFLNKLYFVKDITYYRGFIEYFVSDYNVIYDKYLEYENNKLLLKTNVKDWELSRIIPGENIKEPVGELEFKILLYTNDKVLKFLLDIFNIENDIKIDNNIKKR